MANTKIGIDRLDVWELMVDEDGSSLTNWTSLAGTWDTSGTYFTQANAGASVMNMKFNTKMPLAISVYEAEVQCKTAGGTRRTGIYIMDGTTSNGGMLVYLQPDENWLCIERGGHFLMATISATIDLDTWYKIRLLVTGDTLSVWLDEVFLTSFPNVGGQVNTHSLHLYNYQSEGWFRNIKAWTLSLPA